MDTGWYWVRVSRNPDHAEIAYFNATLKSWFLAADANPVDLQVETLTVISGKLSPPQDTPACQPSAVLKAGDHVRFWSPGPCPVASTGVVKYVYSTRAIVTSDLTGRTHVMLQRDLERRD